jgi:hypothetical protein
MKTPLLPIFMFYLVCFFWCHHNFHRKYSYEVHMYWYFLSVGIASLRTQLDGTRLNNIKDESTKKELKL